MKRCNQCWRPYRGPRTNCAECRKRQALFARDRGAYLASRDPRASLDEGAPLRVIYRRKSGNKSTGPIPVTIASPSTCPTSCRFRGDGCFAEFGMLRYHWSRAARDGLTWSELCRKVAQLPRGQVWRYGQAGDLPGSGDRLDVKLLDELVRANARAGARGFAITHKPLRTKIEREAVRRANEAGFTINLSADDPAHMRERQALGIAPVVVVVRQSDYVLCPAKTHGVTCERCRLCTVAHRKLPVAFPAHGQFAARVDQLVQLERRS